MTSTSVKDFSKKFNSVRKEFSELTNFPVDADQSQSTTHFKSFAHIETSSENVCGTIEALMNANCSKFAANKTIQKICSSNSSKDIDFTLNHLSMSESPDEDDFRNLTTTTSILHTTSHHHTTLQQQQQQHPEFALAVLPPLKSDSERSLRKLIDECVEEKEKVETGISMLEKLLTKIKANQERIDEMKREDRKKAAKSGSGSHHHHQVSASTAAIKSKIKKIEKEVQSLKKKEKEREKEESALRKKLCDFRCEAENSENSLKDERRVKRKREELKTRLELIENITAWPVRGS